MSNTAANPETKSMYLSSVSIRNYRSIRELEVKFSPGLNVIVGRNNTGKTNLLRAIRHALGPSASHGDAIWLDRDDFYRESADDATDRTIEITLTYSGLSEAQRAYYYEIVDFDLADINASKAIIRYEASWPKDKRQALVRRTGGPQVVDPPEVPTSLLESLPITFLPALRDAEASLAPGHRSRLALLLKELARRSGDGTEAAIKDIFVNANKNLEEHSLISTTRESLQATARELAGSDYSASAIKATGVEFDKILRNLQMQMDGSPVGELDANGLGYNNLLYMSVVLEHLKRSTAEENPLLLIEEPEAHLHPQLTLLLADYLATNTPAGNAPQTIVTTHSPTLAAHVPPSRINALFADALSRQTKCNAIRDAQLTNREERQLRRMMDVTRATLYFAKAVILVEGVSEALLIPSLARKLDYSLAQLHISVVPICGVAFETFRKFLDPGVLGIPTAIVTDADPPIPFHSSWRSAMPEMDGGGFLLSDRTKRLLEIFAGHTTVKVFHSKLTLEYDLAEAADGNAAVMAEVWESCFERMPGTLNRQVVSEAGPTLSEKALAVWRGICRAEHTGSKADFAHRLAEYLDNPVEGEEQAPEFCVPAYLACAIRYAADGVTNMSSPVMAAEV